MAELQLSKIDVKLQIGLKYIENGLFIDLIPTSPLITLSVLKNELISNSLLLFKSQTLGGNNSVFSILHNTTHNGDNVITDELLVVLNNNLKILTIKDSEVILLNDKFRSEDSHMPMTFTGTGFLLTKVLNSWNFGVDNLVVRGSMRIYLLIINQIRASNGAIIVSSTGKSKSGIIVDNTATVYFYELNYVYFLLNDIIIAQRLVNLLVLGVNQSVTLYKLILKVATINYSQKSITATILYNSGFNELHFSGALFVRIGNTTDTSRQGYIILDSLGGIGDGTQSYIGIYDLISSHTDFNDPNKLKVFLGNLTDLNLGQIFEDVTLSNYGLYTTNAYLLGGIKASFGLIGGWSITDSTLFADNIYFDSANKQIRIGAADYNTTGIFLGKHDNVNKFSIVSDENSLLFDGTDLLLTGKITTTSGSIGGWLINNTSIFKDTTKITSAATSYWDNPYALPNIVPHSIYNNFDIKTAVPNINLSVGEKYTNELIAQLNFTDLDASAASIKINHNYSGTGDYSFSSGNILPIIIHLLFYQKNSSNQRVNIKKMILSQTNTMMLREDGILYTFEGDDIAKIVYIDRIFHYPNFQQPSHNTEQELL